MADGLDSAPPSRGEAWAAFNAMCDEAFGNAPPLNYPKPPKGHLVYFVGGDEGPIKIGFTQQPIKERLKSIQNGSPIKLRVLATMPGVRKKEAWYHRLYAAHRLHGEWFERHPDILAEIERINLRSPRHGENG